VSQNKKKFWNGSPGREDRIRTVEKFWARFKNLGGGFSTNCPTYTHKVSVKIHNIFYFLKHGELEYDLFLTDILCVYIR
jgi:hypothetical protein